MKKRNELETRDMSEAVEGTALRLVRVNTQAKQIKVEVNIDSKVYQNRASIGLAVGSEYVATSEYSSVESQKTGSTQANPRRAESILIVAGPGDENATNYASSLAANFNIAIAGNAEECDRLFWSYSPDVILIFVSKINEVETLSYIKSLTSKSENKNLLVLAASHNARLEERLHYYWAGIDTHILLPSTVQEVEQAIEAWAE